MALLRQNLLHQMLSLPPRMRYGAAFVVGVLANFAGIAAAGSPGMLAIITMPAMCAAISITAVFTCALVGLGLRSSFIGHYWARNSIAVGCVLVLGVIAFVMGIHDRHRAADFDSQEPVYQLGWSYWPGYLLLVFSVTNFPFSRWRETFPRHLAHGLL